MKQINSTEYKQIISDNEKKIIIFSAPWCGPCTMFKPVLEKISEDLQIPLYGVNIDESMGNDTFEYLIADDYVSESDIPNGFVLKTIPKHTWAVFPCKGPMPDSMQNVNKKIFSEWLPSSKDYEIAAGYCIEMYSNASEYPKGIQDENYYSEIWIAVKKKV